MGDQAVKIVVTASDIKRGRRCSAFGCPVALAACRALGLDDDALPLGVSDEINVYNKIRYSIPDKAIEWIKRFDDSLPVEPFEFEAVPP